MAYARDFAMTVADKPSQEDLADRVKFAAKATHELVELAKSRGQEPRVSLGHRSTSTARLGWDEPRQLHVCILCGSKPLSSIASSSFTASSESSDRHGYNLDSARAHVKKHRPIVAPNYNAMKLVCPLLSRHVNI
eukprot:746273-Hanusia_phi.AAC.3